MSTVDIHTDDANGREKRDPWRGFSFGRWRREIDIRGFIQENYSPYDGDESFLSEPTSDTQILWEQVQELLSQERERGGTLDVDVHTVSSITAHAPGYIDREREKVVGLQTDAPLRRAIMPFGGIRVVEKAAESYGYQLPVRITAIFTDYRKTLNRPGFNGQVGV